MSHTMNEIEELASEYAKRRDALRERVEAAKAEVDAIKRRHRPFLRRRIDMAANARADLLAAHGSGARSLFRSVRGRGC